MKITKCLAALLVTIVAGCNNNDSYPKVDIDSYSKKYPKTKDFLFSGDIKKYALDKCSAVLNTVCEIFVPIEENQTLDGYLILEKYKDGNVVFNTDTIKTNKEACILGGNFDGEKFDSSKDFDQRSSFTLNTGAMGMWYLKRSGNKVKLNDERWNYCYDNKHIDDVWVRVAKVTKFPDYK